jgi:hypothetical protein
MLQLLRQAEQGDLGRRYSKRYSELSAVLGTKDFAQLALHRWMELSERSMERDRAVQEYYPLRTFLTNKTKRLLCSCLQDIEHSTWCLANTVGAIRLFRQSSRGDVENQTMQQLSTMAASLSVPNVSDEPAENDVGRLQCRIVGSLPASEQSAQLASPRSPVKDKAAHCFAFEQSIPQAVDLEATLQNLEGPAQDGHLIDETSAWSTKIEKHRVLLETYCKRLVQNLNDPESLDVRLEKLLRLNEDMTEAINDMESWGQNT